ncbi:MAG: hemolysin III family protein [Gammaproteobacteria bacterium]
MSTTLPKRVQSLGEERANAISHGLALLVALVAVPAMITNTVREHDALAVIGASVFGVTVVLTYLSSMIYHALPVGNTKRVFRLIDHATIYLLIAGTYTPFTLGVLRGPWGWSLLAVIWTLAIAGILIKTKRGVGGGRLSTFLYLLMGWLVVVAIVPLWMNMSAAGLTWLVCGGLAYTGGTVFYAAKKLPYSHLIWHLFVMAGTACHFVAVAYYSAGSG